MNDLVMLCFIGNTWYVLDYRRKKTWGAARNLTPKRTRGFSACDVWDWLHQLVEQRLLPQVLLRFCTESLFDAHFGWSFFFHLNNLSIVYFHIWNDKINSATDILILWNRQSAKNTSAFEKSGLAQFLWEGLADQLNDCIVRF